VLLGMFVMASGMGLTMTPMTELIMSSVPRDKAGVGSAMNDTTREGRHDLGVAILGSILSSGYTSNLGGAVSGLPESARHAAEGSLAGALGVARQIGGTQGAALVDAAKTAWADGLHLSLMIGRHRPVRRSDRRSLPARKADDGLVHDEDANLT
jgi:hypothetical protein